MKRIFFWDKFLGILLVILTAVFLTTSAVNAAIITSGEIRGITDGVIRDHLDPSTWTDETQLWIGEYNPGMLSISGGSSVINSTVYTGYRSGSSGTVSVDGEGSSWTITNSLEVGSEGTGTLDIRTGGAVASGGGYIGSNPGSSGTVNVDGLGSTWFINSSNYYIFNFRIGEGALSITNGGNVVVENTFAIIGDFSGSEGYVIVDGEESIFSIDGFINVGSKGSGILDITNGGKVMSEDGHIGSDSDSIGTVNVSGLGSIWSISDFLFVGDEGTGTLTITNGGKVTSSSGLMGWDNDSNGTVSIDGEGSTWSIGGNLELGLNGLGRLIITNRGTVTSASGYIDGCWDSYRSVSVNGEGSSWAVRGDLFAGFTGFGPLDITNGGTVSANKIVIDSQAVVTVDVGTGSSLKLGTAENEWAGTIGNYHGQIRLVAGAGVNSGTYTPMFYDTIEGDGIVQALGGIWDADDHTVKVVESVKAQGEGEATALLDLAKNQQALISDSATGISAGAAFPGAEVSTYITLTARAVSEEDLASLQSILTGTDEKILSAWNFSTEDYTVNSDNPVYLSLHADSADTLSSLTIWRFVDGEWAEYFDDDWIDYNSFLFDLAFDGTYASFVVDSLSSYAVTAAINTGDLDGDRDVDGLDLISFISTENELTVEKFASFFGK